MDEPSTDREQEPQKPEAEPPASGDTNASEKSVTAIISFQRFSEQLNHLRHKLLSASGAKTHLLLYTVLGLTVAVLGVLLYSGSPAGEKRTSANQAANRKAHPALYDALLANDFEKVIALLKMDSGREAINKPFVEGYALLHFAALLGNTELAALGVEYGATIDLPSESGGTPLLFAAYHGRHDIVKLLIAQKADVNRKTNDGISPLTGAADRGHLEIVRTLLANGANPGIVNAEQETALHSSAFQGHDGIVGYLIAEGLDVNAKDYRGRTPLFLAIDGEHYRSAQLLVGNGADVSVKSTLGVTPMDLAKRIRTKPNKFMVLRRFQWN